MRAFNLSQWALDHRSFVVYLMVVFTLGGALAYVQLGREEDPPFTLKMMVVRTLWPGATANETLQQITDRIEKKLEETPSLHYLRSYTKPGESLVFVVLKDSTRAADVPETWYQVRKKVGDIRHALPAGVLGPFFNDEFGDTYSVIFAFTADGFSHRELRDHVERVRADMLRIPDVAKIDLIGVQDEKIYLEFSTKQLASLGIDLNEVVSTLQAQNAVAPAGAVDAAADKIAIRVSGEFASEESLKAINFRFNRRFFRLGDVAEVKRAYVDPPQPLFRYNGEPAIGLAVAMVKNGDALGLGRNIKARIAELTRELPIGIDANLVADQPHVVEEAVGEFTKGLIEAIAIVLAVSFLSLGWRPGIVVAVAIPVVLAITFVFMDLLAISLQRVSLGALIISLGLLVDDAMITVEMMIKKLEEGWDRIKAATYAYSSTAFPMLTGTLVTVAGFVPVGFARSGAGEYCFTLFVVVAIALIASWIVAVLFTPLTGVAVLPRAMRHVAHGETRTGRGFRRLLAFCLRRRYAVLAASAGLFALAAVGMNFVQQQFFPASDRPELLVNLTMPQGGSLRGTREQVDRFEKLLAGDPGIARWSTYIGQGAVRFYLPLDQQLQNDFFAQLVIVTKGAKERERLRARLEAALAADFDQIIGRVSALELGPPIGWPIKYRVSGPDLDQVREHAAAFAELLSRNPNARNIHLDWYEPAKVVRLHVDQDKARLLGVSSQSLATSINAILSGTSITFVRDSTYLIEVVGRAVPEERANLETLRHLTFGLPDGRSMPLSQVATLAYEVEPPLIWRRQRSPTVTVQADLAPGIQAATVVKQMQATLAAFAAKLPPGYSAVVGGATEESAVAEQSIFAVFPLMLFLIVTVLMIQLHSFQRLFLVLCTAPLALIGVAAALLVADAPMGFVAILGIFSLSGMVIRNSVILIVQIDQHIAEGEHPWDAIISATHHRLRPILLTAAAAILGMVPIAPTVFWGPMAYAVMGGLVVATLLTLVFLPALYAAWFRVQQPTRPPTDGHGVAATVPGVALPAATQPA
jgi:multidrug efflux pump subunit AcrB